MTTAMKKAGSNLLANIDIWSGRTVMFRNDACGGSDMKDTCAKMVTNIGKNMIGDVVKDVYGWDAEKEVKNYFAKHGR